MKLTCIVALLAAQAMAQPAPPPQPGRGGRGPQGPQVVSPEVLPDHRVVFRILAPQAETVTLRASDIQGQPQEGPQFTKGENGVWEATAGPIDPGAYRYVFVVNGVGVVDPRNPSYSQSNNTVWSMFYIPGADFEDTRKVPHGAVASVNYYSNALEKDRRMHIYTPPGYELGQQKYPVFYLLHGAGDSDDSWSTVGRAGFILDNLIAGGKAKPMIVVMPAGHTSLTMGGRGPAPAAGSAPAAPPRDEFLEDFVQDIMPYVEKHYRVQSGRQNRAIAGLSMGGSQTMNIAFSHLDEFAYIGVFSSGILGRNGTEWETAHASTLDNAGLKKGLKLVWFSTGKADGLIANSKSTVEMLKKHGFDASFQESNGGHTWLNWRDYLNEFTPQLFR